MSEILKFKDELEPKYDLKAGRQIFDKEKSRDDKNLWAFIPRDTVNPIDVRLRQLSIELPDGPVDLKSEFFNKWAVILNQKQGQLFFIKGRIKDLFLNTRDIYIKTRKGEVYVVPFDKVVEYKNTEPA